MSLSTGNFSQVRTLWSFNSLGQCIILLHAFLSETISQMILITPFLHFESPHTFFLNQVLTGVIILFTCLLTNHDSLLLKLPFILVMFSQIISTRSLMKMLNRTASNLLSISVLCCWSPPSGLASPASFQPMTPSTSSACLWGSYRGWSQQSYRSPGRHYPMLSPHPHSRKRRDDGLSLLLTVKMAHKVPFLSYVVSCTPELPFLRSLPWCFCGHPSRLLWWRFFKITLPCYMKNSKPSSFS